MLSEICLYLKNWFDYNQPKYFGRFTIENGELTCDGESLNIQSNQCFRIVGSVFNDGVHKRGAEELTDEVFEGAIWLMAIPVEFAMLVADIEKWQSKYGGVDSQAMSPYQSESFGGYSYSKVSGSSSSNSESAVPTWQGIFADRLRRYRKI